MSTLVIDPQGLTYACNIYPATGDDAAEDVEDSAAEAVTFPTSVSAVTVYTLPDAGVYRVSLVRLGVECATSSGGWATVDTARGRVELVPDASRTVRAALLASTAAPVEVEGVRDSPEGALAALLTALATLGLITDSTTETTP